MFAICLKNREIPYIYDIFTAKSIFFYEVHSPLCIRQCNEIAKILTQERGILGDFAFVTQHEILTHAIPPSVGKIR